MLKRQSEKAKGSKIKNWSCIFFLYSIFQSKYKGKTEVYFAITTSTSRFYYIKLKMKF